MDFRPTNKEAQTCQWTCWDPWWILAGPETWPIWLHRWLLKLCKINLEEWSLGETISDLRLWVKDPLDLLVEVDTWIVDEMITECVFDWFLTLAGVPTSFHEKNLQFFLWNQSGKQSKKANQKCFHDFFDWNNFKKFSLSNQSFREIFSLEQNNHFQGILPIKIEDPEIYFIKKTSV